MNDFVGSSIDRSRHTILIVDDLPATRYSTARIFHAAGFQTAVASCGAEALATRLDDISAVVLDVHLPDIDGFEVCRRWRQNRHTALLPVIHLSAAYIDDHDKVHGLNSGADAYLTHPAEPAILVATVQALIRVRMAEDQLRRQEEQLRLAVEAADIGLWDLDLVNETLFWPARVKAMFGIPENEQVSMADFHASVHPDDRELAISSFANACDPLLRTQYDVEYRTVGKEDQVIRWVAAKGRGIFDDSDRCIRMIGTAIEITCRKASEAALRESEDRLRMSDRRKDEFLAMLAHELRNPLAPISAAAELIRLVKLDQVQLHDTSQVISRQVHHMSDLLEDLLDVSRVTRGLVALNKHALDMKEVVACAVEQVRSTVEARGHDLIIDLPSHSATVLGDKNRLVQVTTNLLNNAAKYTPHHGSIRLSLAIENERIVLRVADDGIGIAPELQPHIFELFTQAERSVDRSQGGLGLGLALVKQLIELHDGSVSCESPGVGHGSCFTISLPLYSNPRQHMPEFAPQTEHLAGATRPLKILVVDDNIDAASTLKALLEALGHRVTTENGSLAALRQVEAALFDVILLDIGLPEMDGYELARRLRARPLPAPAMTLIAVTGYGHDDDRIKARDAGFDHHLTKPIDLAGLNKVLSRESRA